MSPQNKSIRLDPKRGLNPCVIRCEHCGESHSVGLLGAGGYKAACQACYTINICMPGQRNCGVDGCHGLLGKKDRMPEGESIINGLCDKCIEMQRECDRCVREGGVYWKCSKCGSTGALKADSDISMAVRATTKIEAPNPVGFDFEGKMCPICEPQPEPEEAPNGH